MRFQREEEDRVGRARELVSRGATLLDVRSPEEFAEGHVEGARNIPVQDLVARLHELGSRNRPVVVYCRSGRRSALARTLLAAYGFTQVADLGGIDSFSSAGTY